MRVRDCACPGTPHPDGDEVYLRPHLDLAGGLAAEGALLESVRRYPLSDNAPKAVEAKVVAERTAYLRPAWFEIFLRHGAIGWNLLDSDGHAVPFDVDDLIGDYSLARLAAEQANEQYSGSVLAPFQTPPARHSQNGQTAGGTPLPSARTRSQPRRSSRRASADGQSLIA